MSTSTAVGELRRHWEHMTYTEQARGRGDAVHPGESPRELVFAHQGGDTGAFDEIVRLYYPALLNHARRLLTDPRAAEDAVQEAFLRAYRALPSFGGDYQLGAWLHRIVANVCMTEGVRRRREATATERWAVTDIRTSPGPGDGDTSDAESRVMTAVAALPDNYREALVLRDVMGLDYGDVADRTGVSRDNARARVHRARSAVRRIVGGAASVGGFAGRWWRRGLVPRMVQHVNATVVSVAPDAVTVPARATTMFTTLGAGAAVTLAAAAPLLAGQTTAMAPTPAAPAATRVQTAAPAPARPVTIRVAADTSGPTTPPIAVVAVAPVAPTITTTTTAAAPRVRVISSGPLALASVHTDTLAVDTGALGWGSGPAELTVLGGSAVPAKLTAQVALGDDAHPCSGVVRGSFTWEKAAIPLAAQTTSTNVEGGTATGTTTAAPAPGEASTSTTSTPTSTTAAPAKATVVADRATFEAHVVARHTEGTTVVYTLRGDAGVGAGLTDPGIPAAVTATLTVPAKAGVGTFDLRLFPMPAGAASGAPLPCAVSSALPSSAPGSSATMSPAAMIPAGDTKAPAPPANGPGTPPPPVTATTPRAPASPPAAAPPLAGVGLGPAPANGSPATTVPD